MAEVEKTLRAARDPGRGEPHPGAVSGVGAVFPSAPAAAATGPLGVPADGVLEEVDGSPIGPRPVALSPAVPAVPWRRGFAAATAMTVRRPRLWVFALLAFLARGGLVVLVLPMVVVPTFVGLANFVGPTSVTAGGPTPRLVALVVVGLTAGLALVVVGTLVAAAAEVALHRATVATPEARSVIAVPAGVLATGDHEPVDAAHAGAGRVVLGSSACGSCSSCRWRP